MSVYLLIAAAIFLDGALSTIINPNSYFLPLLLVTTLFAIYPQQCKKTSKYNIILIVSGLIYDLLYTNLLFYHATVFYVLGKLIKYIYENYNQNIILRVVSLIIVIGTYVSLKSLFFLQWQSIYIMLVSALELISKSIFLNVIYLFFINLSIKDKA